jgi:hypothetical protein
MRLKHPVLILSAVLSGNACSPEERPEFVYLRTESVAVNVTVHV